MFAEHRKLLEMITPQRISGRLVSVSGLTMHAAGLPATIGSVCSIRTRHHQTKYAQVVGFNEGQTVLMPLTESDGAAQGDPVYTEPARQCVGVGAALLGRVLDGSGQPIDSDGPVHPSAFYPVYGDPPAPLSRQPIHTALGTGIRCIDATLAVGTGQRIGIFAGTGVGKSILLSMVARYTAADVAVVALIGERGREVNDFIGRALGAEGMKKAVVVVSTSDESAVMRVRACFTATAIAEYFRDQGQHVLLLMDSLTRVAMAQRQIGLAAGEPPTTKGYTPSVFALMPKLLERSGMTTRGSITGFYSVLVEGDDINEPVSDAVRGILDGHIWLSRSLAGQGHYPAIDVLNSISRLMVDVVEPAAYGAAQRVRKTLATWYEIEDLVNIGAYARGSNAQFDVAIEMKPHIDQFLQQDMKVAVSGEQALRELSALATKITEVESRLMTGGKGGAQAA